MCGFCALFHALVTAIDIIVLVAVLSRPRDALGPLAGPDVRTPEQRAREAYDDLSRGWRE